MSEDLWTHAEDLWTHITSEQGAASSSAASALSAATSIEQVPQKRLSLAVPGATGQQARGFACAANDATLPPHMNECGMPTFQDRLPHIPEFLPGDAVAVKRDEDDEEAAVEEEQQRSKSTARRRQRQLSQKWHAMRDYNSVHAGRALENASRWCCSELQSGRPRQLPDYQQHSESRPPRRSPQAPPASPRMKRQTCSEGKPNAGAGGSAAERTTKLSL
jgi:hypothetical protein